MTSLPPERSGKAALRTQMLLRRDQLGDGERAHTAAAIARYCDEILQSMQRAQVVAVYAAKGSEVDVRGVDAHARQLGFSVAYPRVAPGQRWLEFHVADWEALRSASFGLREPLAEAPRVELAQIGCFFVPGIAFDRVGGRVGWGRGYYDNTFARAPQAIRIGVGYECQVVDRVPLAEHDILLHRLFTEAEIRHFGV